MIELRYPLKQGSFDAIKARVVRLERDSVEIVGEDGKGSRFATFNGAWFNPAPEWLKRGADDAMDELIVCPIDDGDHVEVSAQGEAPSPSTRPDGSWSIGSGGIDKPLRLQTSTAGIALVNERGSIADWRDIPGCWLMDGVEQISPRLLLSSPDETDRPREAAFKPEPRSRPSALSERAQIPGAGALP